MVQREEIDRGTVSALFNINVIAGISLGWQSDVGYRAIGSIESN
jgi:hypothetical protein